MAAGSDKNKNTSPENVIYTVGEGSALTIDGIRYPVSFAELSIALNAIPVCTVGIGSPIMDTTVSALGLARLSVAIADLQQKAEKNVKASLSLRLEPSDGGEEQSLVLLNWVLIGAGVEDVNTQDPFSAECTIAHPAYELVTRSGGLLASVSSVEASEIVRELKSNEANPVSAGVVALKAVARASTEAELKFEEPGSVPGLPSKVKSPNTVRKMLNADIDAAVTALRTYLKWDWAESQSAIPAASALSGNSLDGVKCAMIQTWLDGRAGAVWSTLIEMVCPYFMLEVVPEWKSDSMLRVRPQVSRKMKPLVTHKLDVSQVNCFDLPSYPGSPAYGAVMHYSTASAAKGEPTYDSNVALNIEYTPHIMAYAPAEMSKSSGGIIQVEEPSWIPYASSKDAMFSRIPDGYTPSPGSSVTQDAPEDQPAGGVSEDERTWNAVRFKYLANVFQTAYGADSTVRLLMPLRLVPGKTLNPGEFIDLYDGDSLLFSGKIVGLVHTISCEKSSASTVVRLQYCGNDSATENLIGSPAPALYT